MEEFEKIQKADWVVAPRELAAPVITRRFLRRCGGEGRTANFCARFYDPICQRQARWG